MPGRNCQSPHRDGHGDGCCGATIRELHQEIAALELGVYHLLVELDETRTGWTTGLAALHEKHRKRTTSLLKSNDNLRSALSVTMTEKRNLKNKIMGLAREYTENDEEDSLSAKSSMVMTIDEASQRLEDRLKEAYLVERRAETLAQRYLELRQSVPMHALVVCIDASDETKYVNNRRVLARFMQAVHSRGVETFTGLILHNNTVGTVVRHDLKKYNGDRLCLDHDIFGSEPNYLGALEEALRMLSGFEPSDGNIPLNKSVILIGDGALGTNDQNKDGSALSRPLEAECRLMKAMEVRVHVVGSGPGWVINNKRNGSTSLMATLTGGQIFHEGNYLLSESMDKLLGSVRANRH